MGHGGGAVPGIILGNFGYVANKTQTPHALTGILLTATVVPAVLMILALIDITFYNLDDKKYNHIIATLKERAKLNRGENLNL